jgi:integrase
LNLATLDPSQLAQLAALVAQVQSTVPTAAAKAKKKRPVTEPIKYLTEPELNAFFRVVENEAKKAPEGSQAKKLAVRNMAILRLAYHRGLRASEIGMLQLSSWLRDRDRIVFERLKGSNGGEYHLCSSEVRALKAWLKVRGTEPGPLFPSRKGAGISQQMLDLLMKRYGAAAGLPVEKRHTHALKHSCGTHLLNKGESLEDCMDHLGHRSIKSTEIYARFTSTRRQARDKRLRDW